MKSMSRKIALVIAGIIIVALAIYIYVAKNKKAAAPTIEETAQSLEQVTASPTINVPTSPIDDKLPDLNPTQKTNPFNSYQNPFAP